MGVGIPSHLAGGYGLALVRPPAGGLNAWKAPASEVPPYWTGEGYVSLVVGRNSAETGAAEQKGTVLLYFTPSETGLYPRPSDRLLIDGAETEILSVRPANRLIDYWKLEVKTGMA